MYALQLALKHPPNVSSLPPCSYRGAGVLAVDVVRHLVPDGVVFLTTTASLVTNALVVAGLKRKWRGKEKKQGDETSQQEGAGDGDPNTSGDGM